VALPYKRGLEDRIADLERQVQQLFSSIQNRQGITSASAGLVIPPRATPPTPDSGGHIYASGSEPMWRGASGETYSLTPSPPISPGPAPQYPTSFSSPASITGDPTASNYNELRADAAMLQVCLRSVIESGRTVPIWDS
jgi:hypothetical protein